MSIPMKHIIRDFQPTDNEDIIRIALSAFNQYKDQYTDWQTFSKNLESMAIQATQGMLGELLVATLNDKVVGAVVYVPPTKTTNFILLGELLSEC
jgi:hypothetical protein